MKNRKSSIDGFVQRRSSNRIGSMHENKHKQVAKSSGSILLHNTGSVQVKNLDQHKVQTGRELGRSDVNDSLKGLNVGGEPEKKLSRRQRRKLAKKNKKPKTFKSRVIKWFFVLLAMGLIGVGAFAAYKIANAGHNILQGNILDVFQNEPLKQDSSGRSNFLIVGTSEDDAGHEGADLTDSILVVSVDQKNKNIYMFSVPRDLYVKYDGKACAEGYSGKINSYFSCVNDGTTDEAEQERLAGAQKLIGDIFGLDIQYGAHVNHTVIKEAVDAVGGVDVDVQGSNGDPGVLDRNFDDRCAFKCYYVRYENGVHHLDGQHALYLAQARGHSAPTYGLGNSNFDREVNQQKILVALKEKAMSTGILTNLSAVTKLIDAFGDNLRTNVQTKEIRTLMQIASEIKQADIHSISLFGQEGSVVKTGSYGGASVVMPSAGVYDYTDIKELIAKNLSNNPLAKEAAPIVVLNGTGQAGYGKTKSDTLTTEGYNVTLVDNAPDGTYDNVEIYQIGTTGNAETAKKLADKYKITIKKTAPPIEVTADVKFVIIYGSVKD